jgi:endonuclease YncB( thermonuclease family)
MRFAVFLIIWSVVRGVYAWHQSKFVVTNVPRLVEDVYQVDAIYDSFELLISRPQRNERARIRMIGLSRPWQWARDEAAWQERTRISLNDLVDRNNGCVQVRLGRRQIDDEGRMLAYLNAGDTLINQRLVELGLAVVDEQADSSNGLIRQMKKAETTARASAVGIWSPRAMGLLDL